MTDTIVSKPRATYAATVAATSLGFVVV